MFGDSSNKSLSRWSARLCRRFRLGKLAASFDNVEVMYKARKLRQAHATLLRVMEDPPEWANSGDVYTFWAELEILAAHDPQRALELLDRAEQLGCSQMGYYYVTRARALYDIGSYQLAREGFEKALAINSSVDVMVSFGRALVYSNDQRARCVLEQVLQRDPENCSAQVYLGLVAVDSGDKEMARALAKKAEASQLSWPDTGALACLYHRLGEFRAAIKLYRKAETEDFVEKGQLYAGIAECYISLGDARAARKYLRQLARHDPDSDDVREVSQHFEGAFGAE